MIEIKVEPIEEDPYEAVPSIGHPDDLVQPFLPQDQAEFQQQESPFGSNDQDVTEEEVSVISIDVRKKFEKQSKAEPGVIKTQKVKVRKGRKGKKAKIEENPDSSDDQDFKTFIIFQKENVCSRFEMQRMLRLWFGISNQR